MIGPERYTGVNTQYARYVMGVCIERGGGCCINTCAYGDVCVWVCVCVGVWVCIKTQQCVCMYVQMKPNVQVYRTYPTNIVLANRYHKRPWEKQQGRDKGYINMMHAYLVLLLHSGCDLCTHQILGTTTPTPTTTPPTTPTFVILVVLVFGNCISIPHIVWRLCHHTSSSGVVW